MPRTIRKTHYSGPAGRRRFNRDILLKAATTAQQVIARNTKSTHLRTSLYTAIGAGYPKRSHIRTDYYWATVYNDGRKAVSPKNSKYLLWFRNPRLDPRLSKGYPATRLSEVGTLKIPSLQMRNLIRAGQIIVRKRSPRSGNVRGEHIMDMNSGRQAAGMAAKSLTEDIRAEILKRLGGIQKFSLRVSL